MKIKTLFAKNEKELMKYLIRAFVIICVLIALTPGAAISGTVDNATLSPSNATIQAGALQPMTFSATNDKTFDIKTYHAEFKYTSGLSITNIVTTPSATKAEINSNKKKIIFE